jgi:hypothetical protein
MVKLHVKQGAEEFIYETKVTASVDAVTREIAIMYNLKAQLSRLAEGLRQLAKHGPMKAPDQRGLTEDEIAASVAQRNNNNNNDNKKSGADQKDSKTDTPLPNPHADPAGIRTGKRKCITSHYI